MRWLIWLLLTYNALEKTDCWWAFEKIKISFLQLKNTQTEIFNTYLLLIKLFRGFVWLFGLFEVCFSFGLVFPTITKIVLFGRCFEQIPNNFFYSQLHGLAKEKNSCCPSLTSWDDLLPAFLSVFSCSGTWGQKLGLMHRLACIMFSNVVVIPSDLGYDVSFFLSNDWAVLVLVLSILDNGTLKSLALVCC